MGNIRSFRDLRVYQNAIEAAMKIFEITKTFPPEEKYQWLIKFGGPHVRFAPISQKPGANVFIPHIL